MMIILMWGLGLGAIYLIIRLMRHARKRCAEAGAI